MHLFKHNLGRLKTGLTKLSEANDLVNIIKEELILLGPQIEEKEQVKKEKKALKNSKIFNFKKKKGNT